MGIENFMIFLFTNLFRIFVNARFLGVFLDKKTGKYSQRVHLLTIILCFILTGAGYLSFQNRNVNIVTNVIGLFLITFSFEGNLKNRVLSVCVVYAFNMICDVVVVKSFSDYSIKASISEFLGTMTVFLITICEIFIEKIILIRKKVKFISPYWYFLLFIPLLSMVMIHFLICANIEEHLVIVVQGGCLLVVNMIAFFLYGAMEEAYLTNIENDSLIQIYKNYKNQLDIIMDSQERIHSFQHDMKYHLRDLFAMAKKQKMHDIMTYLEEMTALIENPNEYVYSGNKEIDSNLNYLLDGAKHKLKNVSVKLAIPEGDYISSVDINIILSNLLDNAIAAAERTEEQYLKLEMSVKQYLLYITVENSYNGIINERNGALLTSKQNRIYHGYGLKNINRIVKKYNGTLDIHYTEDKFFVNVMLYLVNAK